MIRVPPGVVRATCLRGLDVFFCPLEVRSTHAPRISITRRNGTANRTQTSTAPRITMGDWIHSGAVVSCWETQSRKAVMD